jgi:hypothetical protein
MLLICARVFAVLSVALYLVPTGAHLIELPHKLALSPADYIIVQGIYRGWSLFGIVAAVAVLSTLLLAIMRWRRPLVRNLSLFALLCFATTQVIFWTFTYPMNVASDNWTTLPDHFDVARRQWEYSHAASGVQTFLALLAIGLAVALDDGAPQYRSSGAHA